MFSFKKYRKGSGLLVVVAVLAVMSSIMAFGTAKLTQASFNALASNKKGVQALQLAESKAKILRLGGYASAAAQAKTQVSSTGFYDEIILGAVTTSGTVSTRTATVNVYGPGDTTARVSLPVYLSSAESVSGVPSGTICIWHGSVASIPSGWVLCNGSNGTPDLRNRFVWGGGQDGNAKAYVSTNWDAFSGTWPIGWTGGTEAHYLSVAEMPSHNHYGNGYTSWNGDHTHNINSSLRLVIHQYGNVGIGEMSSGSVFQDFSLSSLNTNTTGGHNHYYEFWTTSVGGGNWFYTLPPYMILAYIMKL